MTAHDRGHMVNEWVNEFLNESVVALQEFAAAEASRAIVERMAATITAALRTGNKLLVAGNGGSAGDAQHIAGEFVSRLMFDRDPLAAIALTTDSSALTAIGNDYGYVHVFERQLRAIGRTGDVFLGISTSGRSPNILAAMAAAQQTGLHTMAFCGANPAGMAAADLVFAVSSHRTAIIQQVHITAAHVLCALVERAMFPDRATAA